MTDQYIPVYILTTVLQFRIIQQIMVYCTIITYKLLFKKELQS
jgi:hypothetical protein